jgi:crotonobetainyl-CoA:carnitine CoA-transferase CaiB-like acyl-CoA transferase
MTMVFQELKVLDVASFIAGPAAATVLSDFGADVIKVEPPSGDPQRILSSVPPNPLINPYRSSDDRWFMLAASPLHWPALAHAVGHPELLSDPRFAYSHSITEHSAELTEELDATFASRPLAHWQDVFARARITCAVIQTPEDAARDPQLRANGIVVPLRGDATVQETIASPIALRGSARRPATRAPELGEHNDEILGQLGFTGDQIEALRVTGTIPGAARS